MVVRGYANIGARKLDRARLGAATADEAENRLAAAPQRGQRRLVVMLRAHASIEFEQPAMEEISGIICAVDPAREPARHAEARFDRTNRVGHLDKQQVATLRSEEHTSELQSLMRISSAGF